MNNIISGSFTSIDQAAKKISGNGNNGAKFNKSVDGASFGDILNQKKSIEELSQINRENGSLKFSKHAGMRLEQRDIKLTSNQMDRLEQGAKKACSKGIKESLVLVDNLAFIINTGSNTVVTAMDQDSSNDNVYTNIDGTVII